MTSIRFAFSELSPITKHHRQIFTVIGHPSHMVVLDLHTDRVRCTQCPQAQCKHVQEVKDVLVRAERLLSKTFRAFSL